jgi:putative endonuclease
VLGWLRRRRAGRLDRGRAGEDLARRFLRRRGLKILARNYRCPAGEVDLIALDGSTRKQTGAQTLCFIEVKTRKSDRYTTPASAVDAEKRRRIRRVARHYLSRRPTEGYNVRYDIVAIVWPEDGQPRIDFHPNAFLPCQD